MSPLVKVKKFTFDETDSVSMVGEISAEAVIENGGPQSHTWKISKGVIDSEKKKYDRRDEAITQDDLKERRKAQNRKSTQATSEGRKEQTRLMADLNIAGCIQEHSLIRRAHFLDKEIEKASKRLKQMRAGRKK